MVDDVFGVRTSGDECEVCAKGLEKIYFKIFKLFILNIKFGLLLRM